MLADVEDWLARVEGWGNQHVYLYNLSASLLSALGDPDAIRQRVVDAGLAGLWDRPTVLEFPEVATLTSISFTDSVLRLVWQEAAPFWTAVPGKDYRRPEGLDLYEYRAFRMTEERLPGSS